MSSVHGRDYCSEWSQGKNFTFAKRLSGNGSLNLKEAFARHNLTKKGSREKRGRSYILLDGRDRDTQKKGGSNKKMVKMRLMFQCA
jgi:hypothetical protein